MDDWRRPVPVHSLRRPALPRLPVASNLQSRTAKVFLGPPPPSC